ncbi:hypothetical protein AC579_559 [Pseudocercospora musae]|uniref:SnoaL-like domain-containing protein n=1 Tax=Pseudocercospora musae TaxID=113226 RepID=A0A139IRC4_9PEZI|nr:hypothetical protein AC579_559 [Pseudocercospora musae]
MLPLSTEHLITNSIEQIQSFTFCKLDCDQSAILKMKFINAAPTPQTYLSSIPREASRRLQDSGFQLIQQRRYIAKSARHPLAIRVEISLIKYGILIALNTLPIPLRMCNRRTWHTYPVQRFDMLPEGNNAHSSTSHTVNLRNIVRNGLEKFLDPKDCPAFDYLAPGCLNLVPSFDRIDLFRKVTEEHPDFRIDIDAVDVQVDEELGKAVAHVYAKTSGMLHNGVSIARFGVLEYGRFQGRWLSTRFMGARGQVLE